MSDQNPNQNPISEAAAAAEGLMTEKVAREVLGEIDAARTLLRFRIHEDQKLLRATDPIHQCHHQHHGQFDELTKILDVAVRIVSIFAGLAALANALDAKPGKQ